MPHRLEFWFDVVCPYAYLASTQVAQIARRAGAELMLKPVLLGGLYQHHQAPQNPGATMSPARARMDLLDRERQAHHLGVPLAHNPRHPVRTVHAMRLVLAAGDRGWAVAQDLFRAYHVDSEDISDAAALARIARAHDVDPQVVGQQRWREALFAAVDEGAAKGVFGVPAMFVNDGELIWGADQLHFVEQQLGLAEQPPPPPGAHPDGAPVVRFFHDFSSPYSYLGFTQIQAMADRAGARLELVPMLLGALFRDIGTPIVPLATFHEAKQRWNGRNLLRWAQHWDVPFQFPSHFPIRTVAALRVAIQEPAATAALYQAAWADNQNIGEPAVLARVLDAAGFDSQALLAGTQDPAIKAQLKANTTEAVALGACGAPSTVVGSEVFWGQDRIWMAEAALAAGNSGQR